MTKNNDQFVYTPFSKTCKNQSIPVHDFFKDHDIETDWGLEEALDNLIFNIETGAYFIWETIVRDEQGLHLTENQENVLDELIGDYDDEPILYIDELARPSEPWYAVVNKLAPKLILEPFKTFEEFDQIYSDGWPRLAECISQYAQNLSLPNGITTPINIIPPGIRHRLWIQDCCDHLHGLGQIEEMTLADAEERTWRIDGFIDALKNFRDSVKYFNITLDNLNKFIELPINDEKILFEYIQDKLGLQSLSGKLYDVL